MQLTKAVLTLESKMLIYWLFLITLVKCLEIGKDNAEAIYSVANEGEVNNHNIIPAKIGTNSVNTTAANQPVPSREMADVLNSTISINNVTTHPYLDLKYMPGYYNSSDGDKVNATKNDLVNPNQETSTESPNVNDTKVFAKINVKPSNLQVLEGDTAQFNCSVVTSSDMAYIGWIRNNQDMLYQSLFGPKKFVSFGFQSGQNKRDKWGKKTFWNVLVLYQVTKNDEGIYTCYEDNAKLVDNVQLAVVSEEDILKRSCVINIDCWKSDFQCINYDCVKQLDYVYSDEPDIPSLTTLDTNNSYSNSYGLKFLVTAFICGGIVLTIVTFFILSRTLCRKVVNRSRRRNNTLSREQLVYVIGRADSGVLVPTLDKPPTYEICVQSPAVKDTPTKDETPPPSYRQHKIRVIPSSIPPPPYDENNTSQTASGAAESTLDAATGSATTSPKEV